MSDVAPTQQAPSDQPLLDTTPYGSGKDDSITDTTERAAVTQHSITINGRMISYIATAGHLVTTDMYSAQPVAKIFYVSFTANEAAPTTRPVTFSITVGLGRPRFSSCWDHLDRDASKRTCPISRRRPRIHWRIIRTAYSIIRI